MAGTLRILRKRVHETQSAPTPKTTRVGEAVSSGTDTTESSRVLHVHWSRFFVSRSILPPRIRGCPLREGINGAATGPAAHRQPSRCAPKSGKRDEFCAQLQLFHHERHESRFGIARAQRNATDPLRFHCARGQIANECDVRFAQWKWRISIGRAGDSRDWQFGGEEQVYAQPMAHL